MSSATIQSLTKARPTPALLDCAIMSGSASRVTPARMNLVLVTNASDFRRLDALTMVHAGLIIIVPNVDRAAQRRLFRAALDVPGGRMN
jgi:hypothetical protein